MKTHKNMIVSILCVLVATSLFAYQRYSAQQTVTENVKECDLCTRHHASITRTRQIIRDSQLKTTGKVEPFDTQAQ